MVKITNCGDIGDLCLTLPTIIKRGEPCWVLLHDNGQTKGITSRAHLVRPLLESQPLIESVRIWRNESIDWHSEGFRPGWHSRDSSLAGAHASHAFSVGFIKDMPDFSKPWLTAEPNKKFAGRIIINRSPRYNNPFFPWRDVVRHYGKRLVFVGLREEHAAFQSAFGDVEYLHTGDMLDVAQAIAGSNLFIGNQSSCMTIAEGLKHPRILEGSLVCSDCVYPGAHNAQYVFDGTVDLPDVDGSGTLSITSRVKCWQNYILNEVPNCGKGRWGWHYQYEGVMICEGALDFAVSKLKKLSKWDEQACKKAIVEFTVSMNPQWFEKKVRLPQLDTAKRSLKNAGYTTHAIL